MHKEGKQAVALRWKNTYRIVPSKFPPINFFEDLVAPDLMEALFYVESLTNNRLRDEVGDISLVSQEDRVCGHGSSVVMAAFTHISRDRVSRFSDGTFGVYYAAKMLETAIRERAYHTKKFLSFTQEPPGTITMRVYQSEKILKPLIDIRHDQFLSLHDPNDYNASQNFGSEVKRMNAWGIVYNSVRHEEGECIAILRPSAISLPVIQRQHYNFKWDGTCIINAIEIGGEVFKL